MIVTYFRSSSFNSYSLCPMQWALQYLVGIPSEGNIKAERGNVVHKALEMLARKKLAIQNGQQSFTEEGKEFLISNLTTEDCFHVGWDCYTSRTPHFDWAPQYDWCRDLFYETLELHDGMWNPMNRDIVCPEQYFDLTIDEPWAKYNFTTPSGKKLEGQLAIKGTVDLLTRVNPSTFEYLDWKTGMRLDWATGEVKTYKKLREDPQLRLYHYALTRIYPEITHFIMTIAFVQGGEVKKGIPNRLVVPMPFGPEDIPLTLEMLRKRFESIRDASLPRRNISWRCKAFCWFGRHKHPGTDQTVCDYMYHQMKSKGLTHVMRTYGDETKLHNYGDGGGRQGVE